MIIPSLDILNNNIVRLYKGNYKKVKFYDNDLFFFAEKYRSEGANFIHLVDLDGSKNPKKRQIKFIEKFIKNVKLSIQVGGGIRSITDIENLLLCGAKRVVIGSSAITDFLEVKKWFRKYSDKLVLAIDVIYKNKNKSEIKINGWTKKSKKNILEIISLYIKNGLKHLLCTDINKDGTLKGPNFNLYKNITENFKNLSVQASGGISCLDDIKKIKLQNISDVIVGKALLENRFSLSEAISCWQKE
ncbi:1-(5-phosphoribosyl)-5-[(5-phosphoribosylamino)methylideneamino]imidazole-4-carboxamide isomerase [Buchnera aphidicola (Ceratovacuna keduensis)]|uniref:1-(5-phosphoribosyl)-5-[(5- phosphoribosylamino)methylideneamino]imidazole-4- carboxamide isomerase n=1 Tax=Buchnera aphidicola TaxID=9 RepID=UPI0031B83DB2